MAHASFDEACPAEEEIAAFVRGSIEASRRAVLEAHVAECATCRRLLSALARAAGSESPVADDSVAPTLPLASSTLDIELQPGARFGRYRVLDWLGAGGMGVVYSAYHLDLNRKVALKVLRNGGIDPLPLRDLLLAEAQAMAQLAHPNVVTVFDVGSVDDRVFLAMELIEGQTLAGWLRARRREPSETLAMFVAAGHGLAAAHAAGLIHRDFKPDNVLVGNDGRVCVTDFGLARHAPPRTDSAARDPSDPAAARAPQTGLVGTLAYMAPEQYLGRSVDARADQFSFAVGLYEACSYHCFSRPRCRNHRRPALPGADQWWFCRIRVQRRAEQVRGSQERYRTRRGPRLQWRAQRSLDSRAWSRRSVLHFQEPDWEPEWRVSVRPQ